MKSELPIALLPHESFCDFIISNKAWITIKKEQILTLYHSLAVTNDIVYSSLFLHACPYFFFLSLFSFRDVDTEAFRNEVNYSTSPHLCFLEALTFPDPTRPWTYLWSLAAIWPSLWLWWKRVCLLCRRPGFNPWVEKIPWRREWLLQYSYSQII